MSSDENDLFHPATDLDLIGYLIAELHDQLPDKLARFRQLSDLSLALGAYGTLLHGGPNSSVLWEEARSSFVHGNYSATVMLCQGLIEQMLAAYVNYGVLGHLSQEQLPKRVSLQKTLDTCVEKEIVPEQLKSEILKLMKMRNPLSHYREIDDQDSLTRRMIDQRTSHMEVLRGDASFAIKIAIDVMALETFRIG